MKPLFIIICNLTFVFANSQQKISWGEFAIHPNDTFIVTITTKDSPARFYPLTALENFQNLIFLNDSTYVEHLRKFSSPDELVRELARIYKSPYFVNNYKEYSSWNSSSVFDTLIASKKYSLVGSKLSTGHRECSAYTQQTALEIKQVMNNSSLDFREIGTGNHVFGELFFNGKFVSIDFDPGQPRFLDTLSSGEYVNAYDLVDSVEKITESQQSYQYCLKDSCFNLDCFTNEEYQQLFAQGITIYPQRFFETMEISGDWIFPEHTNMEILIMKNPRYIFPKNDSIVKLIDTLFRQGNYQSAAAVAEVLFGKPITIIEIAEMLSTGELWFYNDKDDIHSLVKEKFSFFQNNNKLKLTVKSRSRDIIIGQDLRLPFLVHAVHASSPITLGDTIVQHAVFNLWNSKEDTSNLAPPTVTANMVNYLNKGVIPANTEVELELYYNPFIYEFYKGIRMEWFGENPKVTLKICDSILDEPLTFTDIVKLEGVSLSHTLYPNPTSWLLLSSMSGTLIDSLGNSVFEIFPGVNNLSTLASGIYYFVNGSTPSQKIVLAK